MKKFNITGTCFPNKHYMVDLTSRVAQIKAMVDDGAYFCINRGRQFGKTTTLHALKEGLASDYEVYAISFEGLDNASYETERHLAYAMMRQFEFAAFMRGNNVSREVQEIVSEAVKANKAEKQIGLDDFSMFISQMCMAAQKPLVLIIDEVDQASNYDSFIRMLGLLRKKFLIRDQMPTFQSVILAGVYDIKNLKLKIRPEAEHQYNSPWNIAANFDVEMAFNVSDVEGMLRDYENDHHTGMDIHSIAKDMIDYTSGYPFLVSRICMILDEKKLPWNREGFLQAERLLLNEKNTLFDDFTKKLDDFPELYQMLYALLYQGKRIYYNVSERTIDIATMFGYIIND
ncbi:MAG: AAA family ATPase, partial [Proteobacteria bacterium]|nr:AAA family ATPase [Pseudomonadota bacterium]